jgi:small subunit ribosomal protein S1
MSTEKFDFGSLVDEQLKGVRRGYKFGNAFNDDKLIVRPKKVQVEVGIDDNATIKQAWEEGASVSGIVEKEVKGGYEVTVAGERAFCPFSQIDKFKKDSSEYIGRGFDFLVSEYSRDERGLNVVVSRRELMEIESAALKEAMLAELNEGETLNGTVTRVLDFGAFVDIGVHQDGLVHISEVTDRYIKHPSEVLRVGQVVQVYVKDVDLKKNRIGLTMKRKKVTQ